MPSAVDTAYTMRTSCRLSTLMLPHRMLLQAWNVCSTAATISHMDLR